MTTKAVAEIAEQHLAIYRPAAQTVTAGAHDIKLEQHLEGKELTVDWSCSCGAPACRTARGFAIVYASGLRAGLRSAGLLAEMV